MNCKNPYLSMGQAYGCGQCLPCRLNRKRIWSHRLMLEAKLYEANAFVTLTYKDEPPGGVSPGDVQLWLKRLRKAIEPRRIRFFVVGEYGDRTMRPHYHAALFNFPSCVFGRTTIGKEGVRCCAACEMVRVTWRHGNIYLGELEPKSASYIVGYVTKKMTDAADSRLDGRHPEFCRMSLRPGIGGDAMHDVADVMLRYELEKVADVPSALRHGAKELPLGRYLQRRLRGLCGLDPRTPQSVIDELQKKLLPLRVAAKADNENPSVKARLVEENLGRVRSVESKAELFKQRRGL